MRKLTASSGLATIKVLLDTSVLVKIGMEDRLPAWMPEALVEAELLVSAVSRAEIALKHSLDKLPLPRPEPEFWARLVGALDAEEFSFTAAHAGRLAVMSWHHKDPFDRMILAQALTEDLTVATTDAVFALYDVRVLAPEPG